MKTETDTPRTDAEASKIDWSFEDCVPISFARQLERELAEARKDSSRIDKMERECEHLHGRRHVDGQYGTRKSWEVSTDFDQGPLSLRDAIDEWGGDE